MAIDKIQNRRRNITPMLKRRAVYGLVIGPILVMGLLAACHHERRVSATAPNIIIILVDALRADSLHDYGNGRNTDPFLAAFGQKGIRFANAHSHSSLTKISVASLFTGLIPPVHGVRRAALGSKRSKGKVVSDILSSQLTTLAEVLAQKEYSTAAVVSNPHLDPSSGFSQGFTDYVYLPDPKAPASDVNRAALDWLAKTARKPFFLYLHYMDIHTPYEPPLAWRFLYSEKKGFPVINKNGIWSGPISKEQVEYTRAVYEAQINYWDDCFRLFVGRLRKGGWLDNTLFIILSDHGEEFHDHSGFGHGHTSFEEMLHVPLYFIYKGRIPSGQTRADFVRVVDILPTVGHFVDYDTKKLNLQGEDLFAQGKGELLSGRLNYAETCRGKVPRSIQSEKFKLIYNSKRDNFEFYDLLRDPKERKNIYAAGGRDSEPLRLKLNQILALDRSTPKTPAKELNQKTIEQLKALGYIK